MGLFDKLFPRQAAGRQAQGYFKTLTAYRPAFTTWNGAIYESALVRSAIDAIARHNSKLAVSFTGTARRSLQAKMKIAPNEWQSWSQYFYRLTTILMCQNTAFIVPIYNEFGDLTGTYPVLPSKCEIVESNNVPYLRYTFRTGDKASIELDLCGILTRFQYEDDFFGESNSALIPTMDLIHAQNQGIKEGITNGATYRFMARVNNFTKPTDLKNEANRFTRENFSKEEGGGLLLFPNTYGDIKQIESKPYVPDAQQMAAIEKNVFDYFGVNEQILQNSATDEQLDSFFNGAIEPFAVQLSEVMTRMLFTLREQAIGNRIYITANRLQYMSVSHKISLARELGDRGMITIDEIRALFNYPPLEDGAGNRAPIRGEYYFANEEKDDGDNGQD